MNKSAPVSRGNLKLWLRQLASLSWLLAIGVLPSVVQAQDARRLEGIDVQPLAGQQVELRLRLSGAAPEPTTFTIDDPARISLDLPNTTLAVESRRQDSNVGPLTTVLAAEANGRTRVVMNLTSMVPYRRARTTLRRRRALRRPPLATARSATSTSAAVPMARAKSSSTSTTPARPSTCARKAAASSSTSRTRRCRKS
jgi:hypothetical protein